MYVLIAIVCLWMFYLIAIVCLRMLYSPPELLELKAVRSDEVVVGPFITRLKGKLEQKPSLYG